MPQLVHIGAVLFLVKVVSPISSQDILFCKREREREIIEALQFNINRLLTDLMLSLGELGKVFFLIRGNWSPLAFEDIVLPPFVSCRFFFFFGQREKKKEKRAETFLLHEFAFSPPQRKNMDNIQAEISKPLDDTQEQFPVITINHSLIESGGRDRGREGGRKRGKSETPRNISFFIASGSDIQPSGSNKLFHCSIVIGWNLVASSMGWTLSDWVIGFREVEHWAIVMK